MTEDKTDKTTQTPKAYIYMIYTSQSDEVYIGMTTRSIKQRFIEHNSKSNPCKSKELLEKYDDCKIKVLLEISDINDDEELRKIETNQIKLYNCINKAVSYRSEEDKKEYRKHYYIKNADIIKKRERDKYQNNSKSKIEQTLKRYYDVVKNNIQLQYCEICETSVQNISFKKHEASQKHKNLLKLKQNQDLLERCFECSV